MTRKVNEDKLCSAFYQSMDFLNFDEKKYKRFLHSLARNKLTGWKTLENAIAKVNQNSFEQTLQEYAHFCKYEYETWINSLKFQVDSGALKKIVPPSTCLNDFFQDVHLRIPHEKTLIIDYGVEDIATAIVSAYEISIDTFLKDISTNYKTFDKGDYTKENYKHFKKWVLEYRQKFGVNDLIVCTLTVHTNLKKEHIHKIDRFDEHIIDAITGNRVIHIPMPVIFPCGIKIKDLNEVQPLISHKMEAFDDSLYAWFLNILCPHSVPSINGNDLFWERNDIKSMSKKTKNALFDDGYNMGSYLAMWTVIRQCLIHISVYGHPEFKEFCVNTLKRKGLQPNKTPYDANRPVGIKPTWKPPFEHYMVTVNIPDEVSNEADSPTHKKRHHLVRGHLMRSSGKNAKDGYVWRRSHWRGNKKLGTITKDYTLKIDERIDKKAV
jgi:hypothetical protein